MTVFEQLLEVQAFDTRLQQLRHKRSTLPELAALEGNGRARVELEATSAGVSEQRKELVRRQHRLEDEIAQVVGRAEGHEANLYSGSVTNPRELQAIQDDIESLRRRQRVLEDEDLELMEQIEPLSERLAELETQAAGLAAEASQLEQQLAEAASAIDAEIDDIERQRTEVVGGLDPAVVSDYDGLRVQLGGIAIARLEGGSCGGCHLGLSAVELDRIRKLGADERVVCEECGRLLVR